jgi:protein-tyrosine phosphatase
MTEPFSILFVCTGNICRSPTAEGVFRALCAEQGVADRVAIESAGTIDYQVGRPADPLAREAARRRGFDISAHRARQVSPFDVERFDLLLAMDESNRAGLLALCNSDQRHKVRMFLEFAEGADRLDVPDPYGGGEDGFERVLDLVEDASRGLLEAVRARLS